MQRGVKGESSGTEIDISKLAKCCCRVCVDIRCVEYLNLERCVCRENCESHEMREICEGHVKSSKQFEGVELVGVPRWLSMKSLRIEQWSGMRMADPLS